MPLHPGIRDVARQPDYEAVLGEGFDRRRTAVFDLKIHDDWLGVEPSYFLDDERLPPYGAPFVSHQGDFIDFLCRRREARIRRGQAWTTVRVEYEFATQAAPGFSSLAAVGGVGGPDRLPGTGSLASDLAKLPPRWTYTSEDIEVPLRKDLDGLAVVSTNGLPPDPLPTQKFAIRVITYQRYEATYNPSLWDQYNHVVNAGVWRGRLIGTVLCLPPQMGEWQEVGGAVWYPVTYTFKVMNTAVYPDWQTYIDCYGDHERDFENPNALVPIFIKGAQVNKPWPLNAAGFAIQNPGPANPPHRKSYRTVPSADFNPLNILFV